jgi:hypothetical protein
MPSPPKRQPVEPPTNRALQWQDMPKVAQQDIAGQMRNLGMARSGVSEQHTRLQAAATNPQSKERTREKAANRTLSLAAIAPHLKDDPITLGKAANARVGLVKAGAQRARSEGIATGQDWYFQHNRKLRGVAAETGHDPSHVIAASAVMSPQNNPEQELTAVTALARAHADPHARVKVTPQAAAVAAAGENPVDLSEYVGKSLHPSKFRSEHFAALSDVNIREHVQAKGVDLHAMAKGGVKGNVTQAIDVLRGHLSPEHAIDPQTSPKVWSYHKNIAESVHGSAEHTEFVSRMHQATGGEIPGQARMDVMGLRGATHGPLNPTNTTAEDTWQQAISTRQRLPVVEIPGRQGRAGLQSPAKFSVGEGGNANQKMLRTPEGMRNVGNSATMHAFQNKATQLAAGILSKESGEIIPAIGVQAGGWTEARRHAGKAIEEHKPLVQPSRPSPGFFTDEGEVRPAVKPPAQYRAYGKRTKRGVDPNQGTLF